MVTTSALRGRQREAARNDHRILEAARAVFVVDPTAPIAAVADRAGVGMAALYRRYANKEDLLRTLCAEGLKRYIAETELALSDHGDRWTAFTGWMMRIVDADTNSLVERLAGTFTPTAEMYGDGARANTLTTRLVNRTKKAGALRGDVHVNDIASAFEMVASVRLGDDIRTGQLRRRYLTLIADALHTAAPTRLPGRPPSWEEMEGRWRT